MISTGLKKSFRWDLAIWGNEATLSTDSSLPKQSHGSSRVYRACEKKDHGANRIAQPNDGLSLQSMVWIHE